MDCFWLTALLHVPREVGVDVAIIGQAIPAVIGHGAPVTVQQPGMGLQQGHLLRQAQSGLVVQQVVECVPVLVYLFEQRLVPQTTEPLAGLSLGLIPQRSRHGRIEKDVFGQNAEPNKGIKVFIRESLQAQPKGKAQALVAEGRLVQVQRRQIGQLVTKGIQQFGPSHTPLHLGCRQFQGQRQVAQFTRQGRRLITTAVQRPQPGLKEGQRLGLGHDVQVVEVGAQPARQRRVAGGD